MRSVEQIKVTIKSTLKEALEVLDRSSMSVLLLVDEKGLLLRTITDGDIRRLLLEGRALSDSLGCLKPKSAVVANVKATSDEILMLMNEHNVNQVPVVNENNKPEGLYLRRDIEPHILLSTPHMGEYERKFVEEAFNTNWIAPLGPNVDGFEQELAEYVGCKHAAALSSGTAAIHLALRLLEVGPGDHVICSSFTFVASANPILYQGATPIFVDSEPETWNMSPAALEVALQENCESGNRPKAIIVVHLYGQSADMDNIMQLGTKYDVPVIEDAAESLGAFYRGRHTGTFGKFGIFSFNGNKIITTSGGGMLVSDDGDLIEKARFLATQARDPAPYYQHTEIGYNYRMSNILAGIGRGQLKVLDDRVKARRKVFERYVELLSDIDGIKWMPESKDCESTRWLTTATIEPDSINTDIKYIIESLNRNCIEARHVWKPMHKQPIFKNTLYYPHNKEESVCDRLFSNGICLPSSSHLTGTQQKRVVNVVRDLIN